MSQKILTTIGLTPKEADVYETVLKLGECPIMKIVKQLQAHPQIVYRAVASLQKRGFVQGVIRGSKRYVRAEDPKILEVFEERRLREIRKAIPGLQALSSLKEKSEALIRVASGKEAIQNIRSRAIGELAKSRNSLFIIGGSGDRFFEVVGEAWYTEVESERIELKVRKKLVTFESQRELLQRDRFRAYSEFRYLSEHHPVPSSTNIFNDTVAIFVWSAEPAAIMIKSREVAESYQAYFKSLWSIAQV